MLENACPQCGTEIAATLLACPGCGALVHAEELKQLAATAASATTPLDELAAWRRALELLPPSSRQHQVLVEKVKALVEQVDRLPATPGAPAPSGAKKRSGIIGGIVTVLILLATKLKFALIFLLTNGKLLLLGLTKSSMLLTMLGSFAVYWGLFGWKFAAGLLLSIYVHEMGHVVALRRFGIAASAPMFIPGLGAIVRLREKLHSPVEDARVGLAGPWWGFGAALAVWAWGWFGDSSVAGAIAHVSAWINLLNLTPVWQLDGSRAFRAMSRLQRWMGAASLLAAAVILQDAFTGLATVIAIMRCFGCDADPKGDSRTAIDYCFLTLALAAIAYGNVMPAMK